MFIEVKFSDIGKPAGVIYDSSGINIENSYAEKNDKEIASRKASSHKSLFQDREYHVA